MPELRDKLLSIVAVCRELNAQRELPALLDRIAREAARLTEAERASVFLLDRERAELWTPVTFEPEPIRLDARLGIVGASLSTGGTLNVSDAQSDPRFYPAIDERFGFRTRSAIAVPLRDHEGEIVGAFEVLNARAGRFTEEDQLLLEAFAGQAAAAIGTARLVAELERHRDRLLGENAQLRKEVEERFSVRSLLGTSPKLQDLVRTIERIRESSIDVLITGESGTGKELIAKAIHYTSPRCRVPWVALNCAALPEALVESELFGIERGVATGVERRIGKFEAAHGGTLFLDEIGDLSLAAQAKILRVLQERVVERVGGRRTVPVDVRIVAATNRDLAAEVGRGAFRADLYYRLNVIHLCTVALREMAGDIPLLARRFLESACSELGKPAKTLSEEALRCLIAHAWPGNVRQLVNEMRRAAVLAAGPVVVAEDLSDELRSAAKSSAAGALGSDASLRGRVEALEQDLIREALEASGQNQQQAARALGLSRQGLIKKMKRYGIEARRPARAGHLPPSAAASH